MVRDKLAVEMDKEFAKRFQTLRSALQRKDADEFYEVWSKTVEDVVLRFAKIKNSEEAMFEGRGNVRLINKAVDTLDHGRHLT